VFAVSIGDSTVLNAPYHRYIIPTHKFLSRPFTGHLAWSDADRLAARPATNGAICQGITGSGPLRDGGSHEVEESSRLANCPLSVRHAVISDR